VGAAWKPQQARRFLQDIGAEGRRAYQKFYLYLDFWFPTLITSLMYCSFLALAFPQGSRFAWLAPLGMLGWLFDTAENLTHFGMARSYPHLSSLALKLWSQFTYWKRVLAIVTPLVGGRVLPLGLSRTPGGGRDAAERVRARQRETRRHKPTTNSASAACASLAERRPPCPITQLAPPAWRAPPPTPLHIGALCGLPCVPGSPGSSPGPPAPTRDPAASTPWSISPQKIFHKKEKSICMPHPPV
jgi:hypothetical protein